MIKRLKYLIRFLPIGTEDNFQKQKVLKNITIIEDELATMTEEQKEEFCRAMQSVVLKSCISFVDFEQGIRIFNKHSR